VGVRNFLQKTVLLSILVIVSLNIHAQVINTDSTKVATREKEPEEIHSPRKASLYSAILPGLGQAYNKKIWKIPFIYAGFGAIGYFIDWNNDNYQLSKTAYQHLKDTDPTTTDYLKLDGIEGYDLDNPTDVTNLLEGLTKRQDYYRRNRDLLFISMFGFYGLNIIDASVDAHLFNFDVGDDLTMNWQPTMINIDNQLIYCINISFNF
jgi:hypothetical protein